MKVFKNFKETAALRPGFAAEGIYGGALLGIRSSDFICFYDWTSTKVLFDPCRRSFFVVFLPLSAYNVTAIGEG